MCPVFIAISEENGNRDSVQWNVRQVGIVALGDEARQVLSFIGQGIRNPSRVWSFDDIRLVRSGGLPTLYTRAKSSVAQRALLLSD